MKKSTLLFGTKIETNKNFPLGEGMFGIIIEKSQKNYGVMFSEERENFHGLLNSLFNVKYKSKRCYYLKRNQFNLVNEQSPNPIQGFFNANEINKSLIKHDKICNEKKYIFNLKNEMESYINRLRDKRKYLLETKNGLEKLEKIPDFPELKDNEQTQKIYDSIIKHPKVEKIENIDGILYISTTELKYQTTRESDLEKFSDGKNIGKYIIRLENIDNNINIKIANTTFCIGDYRILHPCIEDTEVCFGSMSPQIKMLKDANDLIGLIYTLIIFLERPHYNNPYRTIAEFIEERQNINFTMLNPKDYFDIDLMAKKLEE